jgi:ATP/maltotriose-dependent transcriptional regulator MalT
LILEQLLATKFHIPPARPNLVQRQRLLQRLDEGLHCKLTLISALAGFGKTTLVNEWVSTTLSAATKENSSEAKNRLALVGRE